MKGETQSHDIYQLKVVNVLQGSVMKWRGNLRRALLF